VKPYAIVQQVDRCAGGRVYFMPALRCDIHVDRTTQSVLGRKNCCDLEPFAQQPVEIA
jgi:hypothetical protein